MAITGELMLSLFVSGAGIASLLLMGREAVRVYQLKGDTEIMNETEVAAVRMAKFIKGMCKYKGKCPDCNQKECEQTIGLVKCMETMEPEEIVEAFKKRG